MAEEIKAEAPVWKAVLLWVAVLPAALLANVAAYWLMSACWWLSGSMNGNDSRMFTFLMTAVTHGLSGYALSYAGAWVAPSGKYVVALSLAGLLILFSGVGIIVSIRDHQWMYLFKIASTIAGSVIAVVHVNADPPKF